MLGKLCALLVSADVFVPVCAAYGECDIFHNIHFVIHIIR